MLYQVVSACVSMSHVVSCFQQSRLEVQTGTNRWSEVQKRYNFIRNNSPSLAMNRKRNHCNSLKINYWIKICREWAGNVRSFSFPDTKPRKDILQKVVGGDFAGDGAQVIEGEAEIGSNHLAAEIIF